MEQLIFGVFIPSIIVALLLGALYMKVPGIRARIDSMNNERATDDVHRKQQLGKSVIESVCRHVYVRAQVTSITENDGQQAYVLQTDSQDNVNKLKSLQTELASALRQGNVTVIQPDNTIFEVKILTTL